MYILLTKNNKDNYGYGEYQKLTVGPDPFSGQDSQGYNAGMFKTRVYNYRDEIIMHETLDSALNTINPGEKLAVLSIDNPKCFTRPLEDSAQVIKFLVPILNEKLNKRGLKIATNPQDNQPIYREADAEDYNYPVGYWFYVVKIDSI